MQNFDLNICPDVLHSLEVSYPKEAYKLISKYDGMVDSLENPEVLTDIFGIQEAVQSSNIEGTIATISDLLDFNIGKLVNETKKLDISEIEQYKEAFKYAIEEVNIQDYQFTKQLFKSLQYLLLDNARGKDKLKGAFKQAQNYIGNKFDNNITYTPISPLKTNEYMESLIKYINTDHAQDIDPLVKVAIIHAQFELIHPFEDGNGRVGRLIISLLLRKYKVLETSYFYISYYLSKNRDTYIESLESISRDDNWIPWINFFIKALEEQSKMLISVLRELNKIRKETKEKIRELNTTFSIQVVDFLFKKIKFTTRYFIDKTGINENTAKNLLRELVENNIISIEIKGSGRSSNVYRFDSVYRVIQELDK